MIAACVQADQVYLYKYGLLLLLLLTRSYNEFGCGAFSDMDNSPLRSECLLY